MVNLLYDPVVSVRRAWDQWWAIVGERLLEGDELTDINNWSDLHKIFDKLINLTFSSLVNQISKVLCSPFSS